MMYRGSQDSIQQANDQEGDDYYAEDHQHVDKDGFESEYS